MTNVNNVSFRSTAVQTVPVKQEVKTKPVETKPENKDDNTAETIGTVSVISLIGVAGIMALKHIMGKKPVDSKAAQGVIEQGQKIAQEVAEQVAGQGQKQGQKIVNSAENAIAPAAKKAITKTHEDVRAIENATNVLEKAHEKFVQNSQNVTRSQAYAENATPETVTDYLTGLKKAAQKPVTKGEAYAENATPEVITEYLAQKRTAAAQKPVTKGQAYNKNATPETVTDYLTQKRAAAASETISLQKATEGTADDANKFLDQLDAKIKKDGIKENVTKAGIILPGMPGETAKAAKPKVQIKDNTDKFTNLSKEARKANEDAVKRFEQIASNPIIEADPLLEAAKKAPKDGVVATESGLLLLA